MSAAAAPVETTATASEAAKATTAVKAAATAETTRACVPKAATAGASHKSAAAHARRIAGPVSGPKAMIVAAEVPEVGGAIHEPRGIETPAKGTVEDAVAWDKSIRVEGRIPVPPRAGPNAGRPAAAARILPGGIDVGFGKVGGSKAGPAIEIVLLVNFLVEFPGLQLAGGAETELASTLQNNPPAIALNGSFALKHTHQMPVGIEVV